jgi:hypothetical protein
MMTLLNVVFFALIQTTGSGLVAQEELAEALNHFGKTHCTHN